MNAPSLAFVIALSLVPAVASADGTNWQRYAIPKSGAAVEIPLAIFSEDGGMPESGVGRRFYTSDRRADLTVRSIPSQDSPAEFLAKQHPPSEIVYRKVTPDFFVVSSIRNGKIWYDRCNRSGSYMNCVLINYPAAEKQQWDAVVTRISQTLN
jgi:hypothetical protein